MLDPDGGCPTVLWSVLRQVSRALAAAMAVASGGAAASRFSPATSGS